VCAQQCRTAASEGGTRILAQRVGVGRGSSSHLRSSQSKEMPVLRPAIPMPGGGNRGSAVRLRGPRTLVERNAYSAWRTLAAVALLPQRSLPRRSGLLYPWIAYPQIVRLNSCARHTGTVAGSGETTQQPDPDAEAVLPHIEAWKRHLLDLSGRNPLISIGGSRRTRVIVKPSSPPEALLEVRSVDCARPSRLDAERQLRSRSASQARPEKCARTRRHARFRC